jgi:voltage-gated potassium channel
VKARRVVIFGSREPGLAVARQLSGSDNEFVLIDRTEHLRQAEGEGFAVSSIDYTRDSELASVGIGYGVDLIFCLLAEDAENVFLTIAARALAPHTPIIAVAHAADTITKLRAAGADQVIAPQGIVGSSIARLIRQPLAAEVIQASLFQGEAGLHFQELAVAADGPLVGRRLDELDAVVDTRLLVLGVLEAGRFLFYPDYPEPLRAGQVVLAIGPGAERVDGDGA